MLFVLKYHKDGPGETALNRLPKTNAHYTVQIDAEVGVQWQALLTFNPHDA